MQKSQAIQFIQEVFTQPFDRDRFRRFTRELLNRFDPPESPQMLVPDAFTEHIRSCQRLGTYRAPNGELLDILIVNVSEDYKIERTRTALRDFVAHKLKRGDNYKEAGLVAFVPPSADNWRFSFVRMEYETVRDPKTGKIKPEERLTPARRYSYLVGVNEKSHTAQKQLVALLADDKPDPALVAIEQAFGVEKVTKEFFSEYARLFETTEAALAELVKKDKVLRADFETKHVGTVDFSKKLLGQIVFLYFIQKKGWLGVPKGAKWGGGPRDFLRQLANQAIGKKQSIFNDILEPLFYQTLATDRGHEALCKEFQCRIPFLNGGLFEPLAGYDWENTEIHFPNTLFANHELSPQGDMGTGILDVFDRYNFTVNEAEPLEKEVAIDPEMLGKVFENLIEENRRKGLGAYYTPREIVHYMCQESLINYLDSGLNLPEKPLGTATPVPESQHLLFNNSDERPQPKLGQQEFMETGSRNLVSRQDLEKWIHQSDQFAHYAAAIAAGTKGDHYPKPPESIRKYSREIDALLRDITVCDPAIGSGAFPVGMMMEVVRARTALTPYFNDIAERTAYHFKRHAIQNSLYGVDIDIGAVEIAKLRLWLSLVVDEEDVQQIKPLPNLDYKIVAGNSLFGVEKNLFNNEQFKQLEELKPKFFNETDRKKKAQIKKKIEDLIHELTNGHEVFDFEIYFSEVFHAKGGFDAVIANPPYVRQEKIKELKPALQAAGYECYDGVADLLVYFYERGVKLLRTGGVLTLITSNKYYRAGYGEKLRSFLARELALNRLIDFGDAPVFEAIAYASILIGVKGSPQNNSTLGYTWEKELSFDRIAQIIFERGQQIHQSELKPDGWRLESPAVLRLLEKLRRAGQPLGEYVKEKIYFGIKTGLNEAFIVDRATRDRLIREHKSSAEILKPFLRGRDVKRWRTEFAEQYLIKIESSENKDHPWSGKSEREAEKIFTATYPAIRSRFEGFRSALKKREDHGKYFWELRSCVYWHEFEKPKILYPDIYEHQSIVWDESEYFAANTCYFISTNEKWLTGLMNSQAVEWFYSNVSNKVRGGYLRAFSDYMKQIPIPVVTTEQQKPVERLAERILSTKQRDAGADVSAWEQEINQLVYALYGLTKEEIEIVEKAKVQK